MSFSTSGVICLMRSLFLKSPSGSWGVRTAPTPTAKRSQATPSPLEIGVARSLCFAWNLSLLPFLFHDAEAKDKKIKDCIAGT